MNSWQAIRQLQYVLRRQKWTGSTNVVFASGSVIITAGVAEEAAEKIVMPAAIIIPGGLTVDKDFKDYVTQEVIVRLTVSQAGDAFGEMTVVGGHRTSQTRSQGRGLMEVEEELFNASELLNTDDGIVVQFKGSSALRVQSVDSQFLVWRDYMFALETSADRSYHPVINLVEA